MHSEGCKPLYQRWFFFFFPKIKENRFFKKSLTFSASKTLPPFFNAIEDIDNNTLRLFQSHKSLLQALSY